MVPRGERDRTGAYPQRGKILGVSPEGLRLGHGEGHNQRYLYAYRNIPDSLAAFHKRREFYSVSPGRHLTGDDAAGGSRGLAFQATRVALNWQQPSRAAAASCGTGDHTNIPPLHA